LSHEKQRFRKELLRLALFIRYYNKYRYEENPQDFFDYIDDVDAGLVIYSAFPWYELPKNIFGEQYWRALNDKWLELLEKPIGEAEESELEELAYLVNLKFRDMYYVSKTDSGVRVVAYLKKILGVSDPRLSDLRKVSDAMLLSSGMMSDMQLDIFKRSLQKNYNIKLCAKTPLDKYDIQLTRQTKKP